MIWKKLLWSSKRLSKFEGFFNDDARDNFSFNFLNYPGYNLYHINHQIKIIIFYDWIHQFSQVWLNNINTQSFNWSWSLTMWIFSSCCSNPQRLIKNPRKSVSEYPILAQTALIGISWSFVRLFTKRSRNFESTSLSLLHSIMHQI